MLPLLGLSYLLLVPSQTPVPAADAVTGLNAVLSTKWKAMQIEPEAPADDATIHRRLWLDLAGRVPPGMEVRAFLADPSPNKRTKLVDDLLASDEFADHWGRLWTHQLTGRRATSQERYDGRVLHEYLRDSLKSGKSYGRVVEELLCGEGMKDASGPANFLLRYEAKPADLAGAVGRHFLGVSLQCAQCHDHPFAQWKSADFWGVAAYFARLKMLESSNDDEDFTAVLEARRGELQVPDPKAKPEADGKVAKKTVLPRLPLDQHLPASARRRQVLAKWVTSRDNPYFARHAVNQAWNQLLGAPLVKSFDNPDAEINRRHEDIVALLSAGFTTHDYDLKHLLRTIVLSRAYQARALNGEGGSELAERRSQKLHAFAAFTPRPLSVDQLYQSIVQATGYPGEDDPDQKEMTETDPAPEDADRPVDYLTERALTMQRSLALLNSDYVQKAIVAGAKQSITAHGKSAGPAHVDWMFLATLARRPTAEETKETLALLHGDKPNRGLQDVLWVLFNSAEFNTNH